MPSVEGLIVLDPYAAALSCMRDGELIDPRRPALILMGASARDRMRIARSPRMEDFTLLSIADVINALFGVGVTLNDAQQEFVAEIFRVTACELLRSSPTPLLLDAPLLLREERDTLRARLAEVTTRIHFVHLVSPDAPFDPLAMDEGSTTIFVDEDVDTKMRDYLFAKMDAQWK